MDDISDYGMAFGKKEKFIWISTRAKKKAGGWGEETDDISSLRHPTELFMRWSMCQPWFNNLLKRRMEKYLLLVLQDNDYIWLLIFKIQVVSSYELYS